MDNSTKEKIELEISRISDLIDKSSVLLSKCKTAAPDFIELNAIGSILHSYYNGIENIFNMIYKASYGQTLAGTMWHSDLFKNMFEETKEHKAILPQEIMAPLKEYLGFRHVFRHAYGYDLDWSKLEPLFFGLTDNWKAVKEGFTKFLSE